MTLGRGLGDAVAEAAAWLFGEPFIANAIAPPPPATTATATTVPTILILRARALHQTALENGRSTEETDPASPAGREVAQFCALVERIAFETPLEVCAAPAAAMRA